MDVREKLVELLEEAEGLVNNDYPTLEQMSDHLIANGVTFAIDNNVGCKWISVEERLPKCDVDVLTLRETGMYVESYCEQFGWLYDEESLGWRVTRWMPLPEPPKGE